MISERTKKAIDIFLDAINEGTLAKGDCTKCAVGNLCGGDSSWNTLFITAESGKQHRNSIPTMLGLMTHGEYERLVGNQRLDQKIKEAHSAIAKTDFTVEELAKIEHTFELNTKIHSGKYFRFSKEEIRQDQINGLKAVVEVMMTFDDCKEDVNEVFTSKAELIPIN